MKTVVGASHVDAEYDQWLQRVNAAVKRIADAGVPLFHSAVDNDRIFELYLEGFTPGERQYHNCNCCKHFLRRYGNLVRVDDNGVTISVFDYKDAPEKYREPIGLVQSYVSSRPVEKLFVSKDKVLGTPSAGGWSHIHLKNPYPFSSKAQEPHEYAAEKAEEVKNMQKAMAEFDIKTVEQVVDLLQQEQLTRSEKVLGPAKFLLDCYNVTHQLSQVGKKNLLHRLVATAPAGFCHPRSSMIGSLLEDLQNGLSFTEASRRFTAKNASAAVSAAASSTERRTDRRCREARG